ncbi:MAG: hypothetical protein KGJ32_01500 [Xanthomonadaceae bacterium]|nr:hypothetical protein [Xanthomonadaceae bacterium]
MPHHHKTGMYTMDPARRSSLRVNFKRYRQKPLSSNIRIKALTGAHERWGVSADENVRTKILRTQFGSMGKREARAAYHQRSHQGVLVWRTGSRVLRKTYGLDPNKPKHAIAAHTPGLKTQVTGGTKGAITEEHGTRDNLRADAVMKTLADPKRHRLDVAAMGKLATVQLFMSPQEELKRVRTSVTAPNAPTVHSVFPGIGKVSRSKGFDRLTGTVHEVREREKLVAASMLLAAGRRHLVSPQHKRSLDRGNGDIDEALEYQRRKSAKANTSFSFNKKRYSATDRLDHRSLRRMDRNASHGGDRSRALSPPRRLPDRPKKYPF